MTEVITLPTFIAGGNDRLQRSESACEEEADLNR
jgi:hypothetical protein